MREFKFKTLSDFDTKSIEFSSYFEWQDLARSIDGYRIMQEIGLNSRTERMGFWKSNKNSWKSTGIINLPVSELLLLLFIERNKLRFVSGGEDYDFVNALLIEIAKQTGINYQPNSKDRSLVNKANFEEVKPILKQLGWLRKPASDDEVVE